MAAPQEDHAAWSIQEAERLLLSLKGVLSARLVTQPGGEIEEIHVLTTDEVAPKQTVRNVESALLAHLDLAVDHRKISVAQTKERASAPEPAVRLAVAPAVAPSTHSRLLFHGHQVQTERSHLLRHRVEIEWRGETYLGESSAADLPRARLEAVTRATLSAVEQALSTELDDQGGGTATLALDGVKVVSAFDKEFVVVAVQAIAGRDARALVGAAVSAGLPDRAAIMATLQATDRWVRGRV
jgi:hypothetical protein